MAINSFMTSFKPKTRYFVKLFNFVLKVESVFEIKVEDLVTSKVI